MKTIDSIIIHCSPTRFGQDLRAKDIDRMHKQRGFNQIGYNYVIDIDGTVESYNKHSIGICYIGGLDVNGKAADTRTEAQRIALRDLVEKLCRDYPIIEVLGHRDTSPDLNDNGEVEPFEYIKACPCFDVRKEFSNFMKPVIIRP